MFTCTTSTAVSSRADVMSLASLLPAPRVVEDVIQEAKPRFDAVVVRNDVPPYGKRKGFIPRIKDDFGDGGAFPEIHVAQYPLDMGRLDKKSTAIVAVNVGHTGTKKVFQSATDLVEKPVDPAALSRPSEDEEMATAAKTKAALEKIVNAKISAARPTAIVGEVAVATKEKYINYTPSDAAPGKLAGKQRIIRMVEMAVDPLEPPKFKHKKVPGGPGSPPVPIMHSPPRKLTVQDQQAWKIPPVVSNWKNAKGYTIPLDKRLAADGRSLQQATINDKFATLSEALYVAERKARAEVEMRAEMQKRMIAKEKEQQESKLRELAARAREERAGLSRYDEPVAGGGMGGRKPTAAAAAGRDSESEDEGEEKPRPGEDAREREARLQREMMRRERKREREREMRQEVLGKKTKTMRDRDRDITEKIALGMQTSGKLTGEAMFDQRLFNQTKGIDAGFVDDEDDDNVYTKAFRPDAAPTYRPRTFEDTGTKL